MKPNYTWSDAELVRAYQRGVKEAWNILCTRHQGNLRRLFIRKGITNPDDLNDLIQETLLEAMQNIEKIKVPESFPGWLYRVAIGTMSRWLKGKDSSRSNQEQYRTTLLDTGELYAPTHLGPAQTAIDAEYLQIIFDLLEQLPPSEEEVLMLHFGGSSNAEIVAHLGISMNAARVRLSKAKKKLKMLLKTEHPEVYDDLVERKIV